MACNKCNQQPIHNCPCTHIEETTYICGSCPPEAPCNFINIGIYKITSPSGRIYIGQAVDIKRRFNEYLNINRLKQQHKLYNSFKKYGHEGHIFEVIENCGIEDLNKQERYWQDFYDVLNGGLNCILTQTDVKPRVISDETREKLRIANIGRVIPRERIEKQKLTKKLNGKTKRGKHALARIVLDTQYGIFYDCLRDVSELLGINYSNLRNMLNENNNYKNTTNLIKV